MNRAPWVCPSCGRSLTVRNQEHVCGLYDLESHFGKKDPLGQTMFDWVCGVFDRLGPYQVLPMKTMIAFANGVNMAFLKTKREGAELSIVLARPLESDRVRASVTYSKAKTIYRIQVGKDSELDEELAVWVRESYVP